MGVLDWFKSLGKQKTVQRYEELGSFTAYFHSFGNDIYNNETVRASIRTLSDYTSKANAVSSKKEIAVILNNRPNQYMNGKDFLSKVRNKLEIANTAFIYIMRDDRGKVTGFYPVPYASFEAVEYNNGLFIDFQFNGNATRNLVLPWEDLAVIRKDYMNSDISGEDNSALFPKLELINTTNEGVSNAIKSTASLRGLIKSTRAILAPDAVKAQKDEFVRDYLNLENHSGIASLDASMEFVPISMNPTVVDHKQMQTFREDVYRYFGVNDDIVMSKATEGVREAFYDARIEPFLIALSAELTSKVFSEREIAFGAFIMYEANRLQFASNTTKMNIVMNLTDRAMMTPNEGRAIFGMSPYPGGDEFIRRLDTAAIGTSADEE